MTFLDKLFQISDWYYTKLEDFIIKNELDEDIKIKKKMAVYYCHMLICYFICLPFFNPYMKLPGVLINIFTTICYFLMLRSKYFMRIVIFFHVYSFLGLYVASKSPENLLRVIGIAISQHSQTFLVIDKPAIRFIYVIANYLLANKTQARFDELVEDNNVSQIIMAVRSLQYSWPLLYIFNHFSSLYMAKEYCKSLEASRQAEEELKIKNQELLSVNERLKTTLFLLEQTNKELKDAINARELFIASVSHELRNPLNSMLGNIELLSLEVNDSKWLKMLDTCKICGEVLLGLINNILDVAKINAERLELNSQPVNFYRLIEKVWVVSTIKMREKGLNGYLSIGRNVPKYIKMDSHRLNQILLNLVGNSTKFTKTGFVKVIITWYEDENDQSIMDPSQEFSEWVNKKENINSSFGISHTLANSSNYSSPLYHDDETPAAPDLSSNRSILQRVLPIKSFSQIRSRLKPIFNENDSKIQEKLIYNNTHDTNEKGVLKIEIIDSGCGISESAIQRLFQAFSQADSSITRRFGGTGLGLYITKQLIQKMGGQINVHSKENIGSNFWMVIPCNVATKEEVEKNPGEEEHKAEEMGSQGVRAMIVDDDPLNQIIMTNYFHKMNIQADVANNGQEALYKFKAKQTGYYSLITMDLQMPIMDGITTCKEIRKFEKNVNADEAVPIAIVTGNCIDIEKNRWLDPNGEIRASFIFRKPFAFEECQSCVGAILAQHETRGIHQSKSLRVLIADDDAFNTTLLKQCLEKYRFVCEVCGDGKEALIKTSKQRFDVILMDCQMPIMDGYTAARQIRAKDSKVKIIGVTGDAREDCLTKARESGMNGVETKPLNLKRLIKNMTSRNNNLF